MKKAVVATKLSVRILRNESSLDSNNRKFKVWKVFRDYEWDEIGQKLLREIKYRWFSKLKCKLRFEISNVFSKLSYNFCKNEYSKIISRSENFTSRRSIQATRFYFPSHLSLKQNYNIYIKYKYIYAFALAKCRGGSSFLSARKLAASIRRFRAESFPCKTQTGGRCRLSCDPTGKKVERSRCIHIMYSRARFSVVPVSFTLP